MYRTSIHSLEPKPVTTEGAEGCHIQELITAREGAPTFAMRRFSVAPGGHTPFHSHEWEHEVFILSGTGRLRLAADYVALQAGDAVLVAPGEEHSFENAGSEPLTFLCLIPVSLPCCR